jgi:transcriptional regulator with XRE-family HTH domain
MVVRAGQAVPNLLLRQAREARNLTQDEVADGLIQLGAGGVTGGLVSKWERGICRPTAFHRRLLCQLFEATGEELGFASSRVAMVTYQESKEIQAGRTSVACMPDEASNEDMDRRLFVKLFGTAAGSALFSPELFNLLRALEASGVGRNALGYLEEKSAALETQYINAGPIQVRAPALALLDRVTAQLDRPQTVAVRRRLSAVAAQLAVLMRYLSQDITSPTGDQQEAAQDWCRVAMAAALEAGDDAYCAYVLGSRSLVPTYQGKPKEALTYIDGGKGFAVRTTNAALSAWLLSLEARAYADLHDARACNAALIQAEQLIERIRPDERRAGIDFFDRPRLLSAKGTCCMILGRPDAVAVLSEALSLHPPAHQMYRSLALLESAIAQTDHGELEAACQSTIAAMSISKDKRVGPLAQRERQLHARLDRWESEPAVMEIRERLIA